MSKTRINLSIDEDLAEFAKVFAAENRTTVADVITQYILALKRTIEGDVTTQILSNKAFREALEDSREKLRTGKAKWQTYDEVFGD